MNIKQILLPLIITGFVTGCANSGRYTMKNDKAPLRKPTTLEMVDAVPQHEPIYPWSLRPYVVLGKKYYPMQSAESFSQSGIASWYGRKFHGHLTANGEVYDMYAMTAAHKTLPIPSYVRVTNVGNGKSIIVRVNDRGPFHDGRVIDLSYSAAYALDMLNTGIAKVQLETITVNPSQGKPDEQMIIAEQNEPTPAVTTEKPLDSATLTVNVVTPDTAQSSPFNINFEPSEQDTVEANSKHLFVQVLAASDGARIVQTANQLSQLYDYPRQIPKENGIYKLRFGPLDNKQQAQDLINALKNNGYPSAYMLYTDPVLQHN